ncbi:4-(cytidine 5'-diphospho)-2-C-methyl-D-erythritol kinase [Thermasporomyces composti]|uniref:4-diphosphocytidyl-2-C-methyl-D-erythritol kinase n=1 Tax=Thermasporomyces composti TaxID=696763 RepID=A0A3D9V1S8_THECX|nr:4-(cytidine 5'-diphospho)-2-C-methyl-D-erythritol kinase [Thermasporomyces composti]REF35742.1 4-diphosphocytidyl-2-C-methyl-D-erythritol kinase [Thermasporomyces composti]
MSVVVVRTPAKVNLALMVGPRRPDGFHDLACVYQAVSLFDDVRATLAPAGEFTVTVTGVGAAQVPVDASNLAIRAARLLAERTGVDAGVRFEIRKGIPVAGGMAGGSSDAAAALVACDALWNTGLDRSRLVELAAELGSDVPFCLVGGTAVGSGHGEVVTPALARGHYNWVFCLDTEGMSTPEVYAELDRMRGDLVVLPPRVPGPLMAALRSGDTEGVGRALANDLQPAALRRRPRLAGLLGAGVEYGAVGAIVSGSGPTCAFLARDADHAADLAARLSGSGLCASVRIATGPVPGARIVSEQ